MIYNDNKIYIIDQKKNIIVCLGGIEYNNRMYNTNSIEVIAKYVRPFNRQRNDNSMNQPPIEHFFVECICDGKKIIIGEYPYERCKEIVELIFQALKNHEDMFEMPIE